ncbi:MAG: hypothetical protein BWY35_00578 [Firmicutes bacterium ADurb.Bin248]|nr:MAG: hypothetical protein BWY35_00578 [Firmicutes bacterium ADurb.Bin248]
MLRLPPQKGQQLFLAIGCNGAEKAAEAGLINFFTPFGVQGFKAAGD